MKTFLAYLLEEHQLSQRRLSIGLDMNQGKISQLVHGKSKPNKKDAAKLEQFFGLPIEHILEPMEAENVNLVST